LYLVPTLMQDNGGGCHPNPDRKEVRAPPRDFRTPRGLEYCIELNSTVC
jgi:hypothetical protein